MGTTLILNNNQFTPCVFACMPVCVSLKGPEIAVLFPALLSHRTAPPAADGSERPSFGRVAGRRRELVRAKSIFTRRRPICRSKVAFALNNRVGDGVATRHLLFFSPCPGVSGAHSVSVTLAGCKFSGLESC